MDATPQRKMLILKSGDGTISKAGGRNLKSRRPQFKQIISHFLRCDLTCHCGRRIPTIAAIKNQEDEVPATRLTSRPLHHLCNRRLKGGQITKDRIGLTFSTFNLLAADSCPKSHDCIFSCFCQEHLNLPQNASIHCANCTKNYVCPLQFIVGG